MDPNEQPSWTGGDGPDKEKMEQVRTYTIWLTLVIVMVADKCPRFELGAWPN